MDPSQVFKFLIVRRLQTEAYPVDTAFLINRKFLSYKSSRICFNGDLCISFYLKTFKYCFHNTADTGRLQ